ncbi:MAG: hypothetical protein IJW86_04605 [Clostridia bacterium]|nr:hypothetical protein [Clostridia bacterium]
MKTKIKKIFSLLLCVAMICSIGLVNIAYAVDEQSDAVYQTMPYSDESYGNFCKIKIISGISTIFPLERLELAADYRAYSDTSYELVWTIDGKSFFLDGDSDKETTGTEVEMLFLGDTTVKLQIISSKGDVLCEDEMFLEVSRNNDMSFKDKLLSWFLLSIILFVGIVGGTVGPWIGKLI